MNPTVTKYVFAGMQLRDSFPFGTGKMSQGKKTFVNEVVSVKKLPAFDFYIFSEVLELHEIDFWNQIEYLCQVLIDPILLLVALLLY